DDAVGVVQQRGAIEPEAIGQCGEAVEHAKRGILRGRRDFGERRQTAFVDRDKIGEGAANIDADAVCHRLPASGEEGVPGLQSETPSPACGGGLGWGYTDGQGPSASAILSKTPP